MSLTIFFMIVHNVYEDKVELKANTINYQHHRIGVDGGLVERYILNITTFC